MIGMMLDVIAAIVGCWMGPVGELIDSDDLEGERMRYWEDGFMERHPMGEGKERELGQ